GFIERGSLLFEQSGVASFPDNKLKPGLILHLLCMQAALARGLHEYNFLAGDERYKSELSTGARTLVWISAQQRGALRPWLADNLAQISAWMRTPRAQHV